MIKPYEVTITKVQGGPPKGKPIEIEISGGSLEELKASLMAADDYLWSTRNDSSCFALHNASMKADNCPSTPSAGAVNKHGLLFSVGIGDSGEDGSVKFCKTQATNPKHNENPKTKIRTPTIQGQGEPGHIPWCMPWRGDGGEGRRRREVGGGDIIEHVSKSH